MSAPHDGRATRVCTFSGIFEHVRPSYCSTECLARAAAFQASLPEMPVMIAAGEDERRCLGHCFAAVPPSSHRLRRKRHWFRAGKSAFP